MKVTYNWLREFVDLPVGPDELAAVFTRGGLEVEGVERPGRGLEPARVAQVVSRDKHPNADRLSLCRVNAGDGELQIVCGATNFKAGDKVVLALPGTVLPDGSKLTKSKIRGVESNGMMCSERELGLSTEAHGLLILPADAPVGTPYVEYFGLNDTVYHLNITPNRPDCLSVRGLARELSALLGLELRLPSPRLDVSADPDVRVEIADPDLCPLYTGCRVSGVKIGPSPAWLQNRLRLVGLRPINNVVDITNFVMLEFGQPLHAFDAQTLQGSRILVRASFPEEKVVTLDGKERTLPFGSGVIADGARAVAIAGVMGLANTQITESCSEVFLEAAYFSPRRVRATSKALGLSTDASYRLERGVDILNVSTASRRAVLLMQEIAGGRVVSVVKESGSSAFSSPTVALRSSRVNLLLGCPVSPAQSRAVLSKLGFSVSGDEALLRVGVPSFRMDVAGEADLIEEIARVIGYDNVSVPSARQTFCIDPDAGARTVSDAVRDTLSGLGLCEVMHYSFVSHEVSARRGQIDPVDPALAVKVLNPINQELSEMRTTLLCGLFDALVRNFNRGRTNARLFEVGKVFRCASGAGGDLPYEEEWRVAFALMSAKKEKQWLGDPELCGFFDAKGLIEALFDTLGVGRYSFRRVRKKGYHAGRSVEVLVNGKPAGFLAAACAATVRASDLLGEVVVCELSLPVLESAAAAQKKYVPVSRFPASARDLALVVDRAVCWEDIRAEILGLKIGELEDIALFDEYCGQQIQAGKKSLAFCLKFRAADRTLTTDEVERGFQKIVGHLRGKFPCEVREN